MLFIHSVGHLSPFLSLPVSWDKNLSVLFFIIQYLQIHDRTYSFSFFKVRLLFLSWPTLLLCHVFHYLVKCLWSQDMCQALNASFFSLTKDSHRDGTRYSISAIKNHKRHTVSQSTGCDLRQSTNICVAAFSSRPAINPDFKTFPNERQTWPLPRLMVSSRLPGRTCEIVCKCGRQKLSTMCVQMLDQQECRTSNKNSSRWQEKHNRLLPQNPEELPLRERKIKPVCRGIWNTYTPPHLKGANISKRD